MPTVLVIDDDGVILDLIRTVLAEGGHTTLGFADLDEVPKDVIGDLVITDLVPLKSYNETGAREWVTHLRDRFEGAPLIIVTAHGEALSADDALGADAVLTKPFDVELLLSKVKELLN